MAVFTKRPRPLQPRRTSPRRTRVFRDAVRAKHQARAALASALFELRGSNPLLDEIVCAVARMTRARRVELAIHPDGESRTYQAARSSRPPTRERRLAFPLRHDGRKLATLRIVDSQTTSLGCLRDYTDIAARALAVALRLEHAEDTAHKHDALVDRLPDTCVLTLDALGRVCEVRGGSKALKRHASAFMNRSVEGSESDGFLGFTHSDLVARLSEARLRGRSEARTRVHTRHGDIDAHVVFIDLETRDALLCTVRDLTEVKAIERALLRRNRELSVAAERLKEVDILKNEFMSNVSHELRTPLTAIIAYAEALLLTTPDQQTRDQFLGVICEQGHKLQELIGGLLDIAKLDSLATELKLQLGSLNDVIESAVVTVQPTADKNQIRIEFDLEEDMPPAYLDELRSQQIVWNLLTNAIKFSPAQSCVRVRSWMREGHVWTSVSDEGPGIAPEHLKLIFQKFVQVDGSSTRRHGGVGLGLDLVKHLVELHGGEVRVESRVGHGSTFSFSIPIEKRSKPRFGPKPLSHGTKSS